jgi:hypothetical protein
MASEQRGKTLFAHLVRRRLKQRPRNIERLAPLFLVDGKLPWWSSGSVLPSYDGGGGKRRFPRTWLGTRCGEAMQWRWGAVPRVWSLRQKFEGHRPLFIIWLLAPDRSQGGVLTIVSLTKCDLAIVREKSKRGWILFGYDFFTNSVSGVALRSIVLGQWATRWGTLGQLWALRKEGEGEKLLGRVRCWPSSIVKLS